MAIINLTASKYEPWVLSHLLGWVASWELLLMWNIFISVAEFLHSGMSLYMFGFVWQCLEMFWLAHLGLGCYWHLVVRDK